MAVIDQELHGCILGLRIDHLPLQALRTHDRGREHNRDVEARHHVFLLALRHAVEVEDEELEALAVVEGEILDGVAHEGDAVVFIGGAGGVEEFVVDDVCNEWGGELAEVLFEGRGDGGDVEVGVGDVEFIVLFESYFDDLGLGRAAGFAVDAFDVHAYVKKVSHKITRKFVAVLIVNIPRVSTSWIQRMTIPGI